MATSSTIVSTSIVIHTNPTTTVTSSMTLNPVNLVYTKPSTRSSTGSKVVSSFMKKVSPPKTAPLPTATASSYTVMKTDAGDVLEDEEGDPITPTNDIQIFDNYTLFKMISKRDEQLDALRE